MLTSAQKIGASSGPRHADIQTDAQFFFCHLLFHCCAKRPYPRVLGEKNTLPWLRPQLSCLVFHSTILRRPKSKGRGCRSESLPWDLQKTSPWAQKCLPASSPLLNPSLESVPWIFAPFVVNSRAAVTETPSIAHVISYICLVRPNERPRSPVGLGVGGRGHASRCGQECSQATHTEFSSH